MLSEFQIMLLASVSIACLHTLSGPDHYLPFVALSKARKWTLARTLWWTAICGLGHIFSSVLLGLGGAALGWSVSKITHNENLRGGIAGWSLLGFGCLYFIWGIYRSQSNSIHKHFETDSTGALTVLEHDHRSINPFAERHKVTPWVMFLIFVLGPCEPLIPLMYLPGVQNSSSGLILLIASYSIITLATMVCLVFVGIRGLALVPTNKIEKHVHSLSGIALLICGAGMVFFNW